MESLERIIAEHPFFAGLESYYTDLLTGCASNVRFPIGSYIFKEGEDANEFYLIRAGKVALEMFPPHSKPIVVETLGTGDLLGWSWLVPPYIWTFHAHATQETRAIAIDGKCLRGKCEQNHDLGYEVLRRFSQIMVRRLHATRYQLLDLYAVK
ncbi:MAG TPA: cyclic nucleotide-binding domain-containing protein [Candidatus Sulfotelmatobacter sp.]|nr:cyclic nucleotide-binding domain-containing protein [Candidatus Sulfotelmatobacter sp.]